MDAKRLDQTKCPHCGLTIPNSLWDEETSKHFDAPLLPISYATRQGEAAFICPNCHAESDGLPSDEELPQLLEKDELIRQQQAEIERHNRAYEVQRTKLKEMGSDYPSCLSVAAWAQRIKDGKDGE
ncbi:hypothetical protein [Paenibacillus kobensis]|uniref:hypothetical protein n=1 Tax=Paenibacillus kobensis TaxID=59841 RepID=UPI000FD995AA|nr:hypothetical protein [Paenibacillus kobensis]